MPTQSLYANHGTGQPRVDLHVVSAPEPTVCARRRLHGAVLGAALPLVVDVVALAVCLAVMALVAGSPSGVPVPWAALLAGLGLTHLVVLRACAPWSHRLSPSLLAEIPAVLRAVAYGAGLDLVAAELLGLPHAVAPVAAGVATGGVLLPLVRGAVLAARVRARRESTHAVATVVLGEGDQVDRVCALVTAQPEAGLRLVGTLGPHRIDGHAWLGGLDVLSRVLVEHGVGQVLFPSGLADDEEVGDVVAAHAGRRARISWVAGSAGLVPHDGRHDRLGRFGVIHLREPRRRPVARAARELLDRLLAGVLLLLVVPVLLVAAVALVLDSRGPVLFRQTRVGLHGRPFRILKLRSMTADAELLLGELLVQNQAHGPLFKIRDDPRVTRVGRLLRRTSLDELPQLWNVVRGQMSLIGPRPPLPEEVAVYPGWFYRRLDVKPGITGLWQVNGRTELPFSDAALLDLCYVDDWTPWLDVQILLRTAGTVLTGRGSY